MWVRPTGCLHREPRCAAATKPRTGSPPDVSQQAMLARAVLLLSAGVGYVGGYHHTHLAVVHCHRARHISTGPLRVHHHTNGLSPRLGGCGLYGKIAATDTVYMQPSGGDKNYYIGRVEKIEEWAEDGEMVRVSWFYRPEEALGGRKVRTVAASPPVPREPQLQSAQPRGSLWRRRSTGTPPPVDSVMQATLSTQASPWRWG
jgi:hypothetical protein